MSKDRNRGVVKFYTDALNHTETEYEQVGWESAAVQRLRFESLLEAMAPQDLTARTRLLDVGCGFGELVSWLRQTGRSVDYTGIDLMPEMIQKARERHGDTANVRFEVADFLEFEAQPFDMVLCSGALSLAFDDEQTSWRFIEKMWSLTDKVLVFNLQSMRGIEDPAASALRTDFWHVEPAMVFEKLRTMCEDVVLREDTVPSDLVVWMYRDYCRTLRSPHFDGLATAEVLVQRGEYAAAITALEFHDASDAEEARKTYLLAISHAHEGNDDKAFELLEKTHRLEPDDLDVLESLVHFCLMAEAMDRAKELVLALPSEGRGERQRDDIRSSLHEVLAVTGDDTAVVLEKAAETEFGRGLMMGGRLVSTRQWEQAEVVLRSAISARPEDGRPVPLLAATLLRLGQSIESLERLSDLLLASPNLEVARQIALEAMRAVAVDVKRKKSVEARQALEAVREHPILGTIAKRLLV